MSSGKNHGRLGFTDTLSRGISHWQEKDGLFILVDKPCDELGVVELVTSGLREGFFHCTDEWGFSIVAIHGLGGYVYTSWKDRGKIWLRDFGPAQISNARVISFGYDSLVASSKSVAGIEDFAADLLNRLNDERTTAQVGVIYFVGYH